MRFATMCSGIGAPEVAFSRMGWKCAFQSEIDPFACAVLAQRFWGIENRGDMTYWENWPVDEDLDLLVAGTPCQSFSVAGKRGGMSDSRGNLAMEFVNYANRVRPRWVLWENVPGVLSDNGNAFGEILGGLAGFATTIRWRGQRWGNAGIVSGPKRQVAWRILDAQYFGLAQRRRRVFVLAGDVGRGTGGWACARALFPHAPRMRGYFAPGENAESRIAGISSGGVEGGGRGGDGGGMISNTLTAGVGRGRGLGFDEGVDLVAGPITASYDRSRGRTGGNNGGLVDGHLIASPLTSSMGARRGCGAMEVCGALVAHTLRGRGHDASEDETGRGVPLVFEPRITGKGDGAPCLIERSGVRRLTPRECERLMGFPDDWTLIPWRGRQAAECPDGPRYRAIGNSMAVPVVMWIGAGIAECEKIGGAR